MFIEPLSFQNQALTKSSIIIYCYKSLGTKKRQHKKGAPKDSLFILEINPSIARGTLKIKAVP